MYFDRSLKYKYKLFKVQVSRDRDLPWTKLALGEEAAKSGGSLQSDGTLVTLVTIKQNSVLIQISSKMRENDRDMTNDIELSQLNYSFIFCLSGTMMDN